MIIHIYMHIRRYVQTYRRYRNNVTVHIYHRQIHAYPFLQCFSNQHHRGTTLRHIRRTERFAVQAQLMRQAPLVNLDILNHRSYASPVTTHLTGSLSGRSLKVTVRRALSVLNDSEFRPSLQVTCSALKRSSMITSKTMGGGMGVLYPTKRE